MRDDTSAQENRKVFYVEKNYDSILIYLICSPLHWSGQMKSGGKEPGPQKRYTAAGTNPVSDHSKQLTGIPSPKHSTSTLVQVLSGPATLKRRVSLSKLERSPSRFTLSRPFFFTRLSVCSSRAPSLGWGARTFDDSRRAGRSFTGSSIVSRVSATVGFNQG